MRVTIQYCIAFEVILLFLVLNKTVVSVTSKTRRSQSTVAKVELCLKVEVESHWMIFCASNGDEVVRCKQHMREHRTVTFCEQQRSTVVLHSAHHQLQEMKQTSSSGHWWLSGYSTSCRLEGSAPCGREIWGSSARHCPTDRWVSRRVLPSQPLLRQAVSSVTERIPAWHGGISYAPAECDQRHKSSELVDDVEKSELAWYCSAYCQRIDHTLLMTSAIDAMNSLGLRAMTDLQVVPDPPVDYEVGLWWSSAQTPCHQQDDWRRLLQPRAGM